MRKSICWMVLTGCVAATTGCVNQQENTRPAPVVDMNAVRQAGLRPAIGTDVELGEKTKAKVAAATTVKVLAGLFGGGFQTVQGGPRNPEPIGGYTQIDGHATVFTSEEASTFKSPASAMAEAMNRKMKAAGVVVDPKSAYSLNVTGKVWGLDYDKMSEKDNYRLYYDVQVTLMDGDKSVRMYDCQGVTQDKRGLDDWEANDKAVVKKDASVIGDICADKALAALDLVSNAGTGASASAASASTAIGTTQ
jgi:hypothetical protein